VSRRVTYLLVDAFTEQPGHGNRAGVILDAEGLTPEDMQRVASILRVSETVFVTRAFDADHWVRYYTPTQEVEFCGHATVALGHVLATNTRLGEARAYLKTLVGSVAVDVEYEFGRVACVWMRQPDAAFRPLPPGAREAMAEALGVDPRLAHRALPAAAASTGLWSAYLPLVDAAILEGLEPDFEAIAGLSRAWGVTSVYAYAATSPTAFVARDFAPAVGIPEDPVTGSSAGALAALLERAGALPRAGESLEIRVSQGHALGTPGEVRVVLEARAGGRPDRILVGGCAVTVYEGVLKL
jgi:PhzF family phenazine biosynthesis protein